MALGFGDIETLLVSPDGVIGLIPFAGLPGKKPNSFLVEDCAIAMIPIPQSLPQLLSAQDQVQSEPSLLLLGDPDFDAVSSESAGLGDVHRGFAIQAPTQSPPKWGPLPGTKQEVFSISQIFEQQFPGKQLAVLTSNSATESAVKEKAPHYRWLHFATSAFFHDLDVVPQDEEA